MYESFFGLAETPFRMTPDPRYLFLSESHEEALSALLYGIREKKGLLTLTGPVGVGKTTILFTFLDRLGPKADIAFFPGGVTGSRVDFFREICGQFRIPSDHGSLFDLTRELKDFTRGRIEKGRHVIVLVDEAQDLGVEELNHFRYMNNLETPDAKSLQIVLAGSEGLDEKLRDERLCSLRQRIAIRGVIHPLNPEASVEYILHRLRVAGSGTGDLFTPGALWRIVNHSGGIPRIINVVCDNTMIVAFALKKAPIEEAFAAEAIEGIEGKGFERGAREVVGREEIESLCKSASLRLRGKASRPSRISEVGGGAPIEATDGGPAERAPERAAREPGEVFVPRRVSVPLPEPSRPSGGRPKSLAIVGGLVLVVTLCVLLRVSLKRRAPDGIMTPLSPPLEQTIEVPFLPLIEAPLAETSSTPPSDVQATEAQAPAEVYQMPVAETGAPFYTVQAVSYRQEANIRNAADRLCDRGFEDVLILPPDPDAGPEGRWFACCAGAFPSAEAARGARPRVRAAGYPDAFIVRIEDSKIEDIRYPCGDD